MCFYKDQLVSKQGGIRNCFMEGRIVNLATSKRKAGQSLVWGQQTWERRSLFSRRVGGVESHGRREPECGAF